LNLDKKVVHRSSPACYGKGGSDAGPLLNSINAVARNRFFGVSFSCWILDNEIDVTIEPNRLLRFIEIDVS